MGEDARPELRPVVELELLELDRVDRVPRVRSLLIPRCRLLAKAFLPFRFLLAMDRLFLTVALVLALLVRRTLLTPPCTDLASPVEILVPRLTDACMPGSNNTLVVLVLWNRVLARRRRARNPLKLVLRRRSVPTPVPRSLAVRPQPSMDVRPITLSMFITIDTVVTMVTVT